MCHEGSVDRVKNTSTSTWHARSWKVMENHARCSVCTNPVTLTECSDGLVLGTICLVSVAFCAIPRKGFKLELELLYLLYMMILNE